MAHSKVNGNHINNILQRRKLGPVEDLTFVSDRTLMTCQGEMQAQRSSGQKNSDKLGKKQIRHRNVK